MLCWVFVLGRTAMSIRTHVVESALLIHVVQRFNAQHCCLRVNSSIHIVRNRSVLFTQDERLAEQHVCKMQDNGEQRGKTVLYAGKQRNNARGPGT